MHADTRAHTHLWLPKRQLMCSHLSFGSLFQPPTSSAETLFCVSSVCFPLDAPPLSVVTATEADSFLSPSGPIAARARDAHNVALQAGRLPWWKTLGAMPSVSVSAHLPEVELELGGLFVGGLVGVGKETERGSSDF